MLKYIDGVYLIKEILMDENSLLTMITSTAYDQCSKNLWKIIWRLVFKLLFISKLCLWFPPYININIAWSKKLTTISKKEVFMLYCMISSTKAWYSPPLSICIKNIGTASSWKPPHLWHHIWMLHCLVILSFYTLKNFFW